MASLEKSLRILAVNLGAELIGITTRKILSDGPPSSDPSYVLSSASSVISFAVSLDQQLAQDFIAKKSWQPHCEDRKAIGQRLYTIGDSLVNKLMSEGHEAVNVDLNNSYRPEDGAADVTEMTDFHPNFSHRYAALASGIGRLGWSGNLVTKKYGALVELGSVITSAELKPDNPIPDTEHPCDKCRICCKACPAEMINPREETAVTVAGITEKISQKQPNTCCWISCTGYEGLSTSTTWSNWSPYRLGHPLPKDKAELNSLCMRLQKSDPQMQDGDSSFADYRRAIFDPHWFYYTVCGFCRSVCVPNRKERIANLKRIIESGTAALKPDGLHVAAGENAVEMGTPYGVNVVFDRKKESTSAMGKKWPGQFPLDREVIEYILLNSKSDDSE